MKCRNKTPGLLCDDQVMFHNTQQLLRQILRFGLLTSCDMHTAPQSWNLL
jgi:hypothetical protein